MSAVKKLVICGFLALASLLTLGGLYDAGYWRFNYPDSRRRPVRGIDVSRHQGRIDRRHVALQRVSFAYIKATEGGSTASRGPST